MARIGFRLGPFHFSQRLGRTQAQKNAARKAAAARRASHRTRAEREEAQAAVAAAHARIDRTYTRPVTVAADGNSFVVTDSIRGAGRITDPSGRFSVLHDGDVVKLTLNENGDALERLELLWYADGRDASGAEINRLR